MNSSHQIFEQNYLNVRERENRVYTDDQVKGLPFISPDKNQEREWKLRAKTTNRFLRYLARQKFKNVLDLGCGNGWFTHQLASTVPEASVMGADINTEELAQASRCFTKKNLRFDYLDVFDFSPSEKYDLITINAAIQYFQDIPALLEKIRSLLTEQGEFHVLDSPVYEDLQQIEQAKLRSSEYYQKMQVPEMANSYFHHCWSDFEEFEVLYSPQKNKVINKLLNDSPFPWLYFTNR